MKILFAILTALLKFFVLMIVSGAEEAETEESHVVTSDAAHDHDGDLKYKTDPTFKYY